MELYWQIAERALELSLVHKDTPPTIQRFKIDLGKNKYPDPNKGMLILGAGSNPLSNAHFVLTELDAQKDFNLIALAFVADSTGRLEDSLFTYA